MNAAINIFLFQVVQIAQYEQIKEEISRLSKTVVYEQGRFNLLDPTSTLQSLPILHNWFNENNLQVRHAAYISVFPHLVQQAHLDYGDAALALNFPVTNCENSTTQFFEFKKQDLTVHRSLGTGQPYYHYNNLGKNVIGSLILTQPTLLNIKMPHSVANVSGLERISLSFRFTQDPWHLTDRSTN